jgi:type III pantothenate kinase
MLPKVALEAPKKVVARNTIDCMKVGIVYGHAEMITGLVNLLEKEIGYTCKKVLTGGGANYIKDVIRGDFILDQGICREGLHDILKRNLI